ncbi:polysaccharide lyase family 8 super-sandwich domain-containing protein [Flavilitoribacter nigricans]|uniref:Chondroitin lyase n=1 Tax=Flavilitoribacter nigricans (strain ATCC 23147 / DSM 23189 / NBRC 102662 / NCIMB 1420 / SS-2) TaxID=1122177 RepID=A0A2D0N7J7_FLAN2|nr:polysaccharide lyase family 8 super-sandwich domain-containing protein [Flavilitoribacter nigricans]PHN04494.1 chondroitin lyase [Flavilitoribacter nigricans DSM 23189 = NBRC 102662]
MTRILLIILLCLGGDELRANPDLETIRNRFVAELMAPTLDESSVRKILSEQQADGTWPDINYQDVSRTGFEHGTHLSRMVELSRAYKKEGNTYYDSKVVKTAIYKALDYWLANDFICDNWWWNQIGTPDRMVQTFLIFDDELSATQKEKARPIITRANINAWGARPGGDRIKIAGIQGRYALFLRDSEMLDEAVGVIIEEIKTSEGRGLQVDMSFHHRHDRVNNTLSYGKGYADAFADWAVKLKGTKYRIPEKRLALLIDYYLDGICQMMPYGKYPDPGAKNRSVSRKGTLGSYDTDTPEKLSSVTDYRSDELENIIAVRKGATSPARAANRFFWHSEYFSHQRPDFFTSARMYSRRNHSMEEPYNSEGLKNHHLGEGSNFISRTGTEYQDIFPVLDWHKIPGTTVIQNDRLPDPDEIQKKGLSDFVGGVSNGTYGAAAFDFISPYDPLQAKKAWFMFDREFVCLGAGITARGSAPVVTTLNQCHLRGDVVVHNAEGTLSLPRGTHDLKRVEWVLHDSIAYFLQAPATVQVSNETATGSWWGISHQSTTSREALQMPVFKLWVDHGSRPGNESYAYTVLPAVDEKTAADYQRDPQVEILSNTPDLQAVRHQGLQLIQAVFYKSGTLSLGDKLQVRMDGPGMIMLQLAGGKINEISVADPSRKFRTMRFDISAPVITDHPKVRTDRNTSKGKTTFTIELPQDGYAGQSVTFGVQ